MTCSSSVEAGGDSPSRQSDSGCCCAFQRALTPHLLVLSCRNPTVLHQLQYGASQPFPAGTAHIYLHGYTFVYVPKGKNGSKPEEDLSVIRHTCRQLAAAPIAIRFQQPQIVFLKHQAAATLMQSGLSLETALIAGIPSLGICVRAATRCVNLTPSQVHSGVPVGQERFVCRRAAGFFFF